MATSTARLPGAFFFGSPTVAVLVSVLKYRVAVIAGELPPARLDDLGVAIEGFVGGDAAWSVAAWSVGALQRGALERWSVGALERGAGARWRGGGVECWGVGAWRVEGGALERGAWSVERWSVERGAWSVGAWSVGALERGALEYWTLANMRILWGSRGPSATRFFASD